MRYERLLEKQEIPSEDKILHFIGNKAKYWLQIHEFIEENYDFEKQLAFFSKNYGWTVRYRKSKKTLVSCFPEHNAFSVLLVLGRTEAEKVNKIREELCQSFLEVFDTTEQLHDGRWLWFRVLEQQDLDSLIKVIKVKRNPKKKS